LNRLSNIYYHTVFNLQYLQPLVRFRRAVKNVQTLLKATVINNGQTSRNEGKLLSWAQADFMSTKREFEMHGLSFDPGDYKARREVNSLTVVVI
jgi:hypothetical protein